jgi:branched-chain amino acid transport system ATP-binding protein
VGLIGPNGSGKTTFFNVLTGYYRPDGGRVRLGGMDITGCRPAEACRQGIARTFQLVRPFSQLTARENVMVGRAYGAAPARSLAQAAAEAEELLGFVGLADRPRLLLLDELMAGLNPTETVAAMELVRRIRAQGISVIMVEHIMQAVLGVSDRVVVLNAGQKIAEGPPEAVVANPAVIEAYLGRSQYPTA